MPLQPFPILPSNPAPAGTATYVMLDVTDGSAPPEYIQGFTTADEAYHPERRRFDGHAYVPAQARSPRDLYDEQVIEEEYLDGLGEGARRDFLAD